MFNLQNRFSLFQRQPEIIKLISLYRYISLICTSIFYFAGITYHSIGTKLFIILCLAVSSIILEGLYLKNIGRTSHILLLIAIETAGNILILVPSGGINSPYIWYCLNTILIASVELKKRYCWGNLLIYLSVANWISQIVLIGQIDNFSELMNKEFNLTLGLILVTLAMQLLAKYAGDIESESRKLSAAITELNLANNRIRKTMGCIMELYQAINLLSAQNEKAQVLDLIIQYARKFTSSQTALFYSIEKEQPRIVVNTDDSAGVMKKLSERLAEMLGEDFQSDVPFCLDIDGMKFMLVFVKSSYVNYGILGIGFAGRADDSSGESLEQLKILSVLSGIVLQKIELEQVNGRLLVAEEQNRIASEIHDGILQRLFIISCSIFMLIRKCGPGGRQIGEELRLIRESIRNAMKDLRKTIYGLSWQKDGSDNFLPDVQSRINEIRSLYGNEINFSSSGDTSQLTVSKKKALYRIICEGVGNAINHGRASKIDVTLDTGTDHTILKIIDNGVGFNVENTVENGRKGLGINNIRQMVRFLNGNIRFESEPGKGTEIVIDFPDDQYYKEQIV